MSSSVYLNTFEVATDVHSLGRLASSRVTALPRRHGMRGEAAKASCLYSLAVRQSFRHLFKNGFDSHIYDMAVYSVMPFS